MPSSNWRYTLPPSLWDCICFPKPRFWKDADKCPNWKLSFRTKEAWVICSCLNVFRNWWTCSSLELVMLRGSVGECMSFRHQWLSGPQLQHRERALLIWSECLSGFFHGRFWLWYIWLFIWHLKENDSPLWKDTRCFIISDSESSPLLVPLIMEHLPQLPLLSPSESAGPGLDLGVRLSVRSS